MSIPTSFHLAPSPLYGTYYHRGANWGVLRAVLSTSAAPAARGAQHTSTHDATALASGAVPTAQDFL